MTIEYPNEVDRQIQSSSPTPSEAGTVPEARTNNSHVWRNWSLIGVVMIALAAGVWWYYSSQIKNSLPPTEEDNIVTENNTATTTDGQIKDKFIAYTTDGRGLSQEILMTSNELWKKLSQLITPILLCLDNGQELNFPTQQNLLCDGQGVAWPELPGGYQWSQDFISSSDTLAWQFSVISDSFLDINCNQTGCSLEDYEKVENVEQEESIDSDKDGLSDIDEVAIWLTDPNKQDSDGDGYSDGQEVASGYNPLGIGTLVIDLNGRPNYSQDNELFKEIDFDQLDYLIKRNNTPAFKYNYFDIPQVKEATSAEAMYKFPIEEGEFANLQTQDQVSNVAAKTMLYVKSLPEFYDEYQRLYGQYGGGFADGGMSGTSFDEDYYVFTMLIAWPDEDSICDSQVKETAFRQALINKRGDVYFIGAACISPGSGEIIKAVGYTLK